MRSDDYVIAIALGLIVGGLFLINASLGVIVLGAVYVALAYVLAGEQGRA